ncbi:MAG: signal peptidase I [Acidobacteriota bacterium]|nr:signal peptidase I [Acidobacteriota bacterium]
MEPTSIPETEQGVAAEHAAQTSPPPPKKGDSGWDLARSLLIIIVGVFCIRTFIGEATVIPTGSMENTILIGDHVFLDKLPYGPRVPYTSLRLPMLKSVHRGDIIAFHYPVNPSLMYVKRVIGVGGDVIRVVNKQVYRNGKKLNEPYAIHAYPDIEDLRDNFPPSIEQLNNLAAEWGLDPNWAREMPRYIYPDGLHVPKGYLFVMGDNRDNSSDSRFWGFVPLQNVVGEPLFVYWSYNAPTRDWMSESLEGRLRFDGSIIVNFIQRTRWSRMGKLFLNPQ